MKKLSLLLFSMAILLTSYAQSEFVLGNANVFFRSMQSSDAILNINSSSQYKTIIHSQNNRTITGVLQGRPESQFLITKSKGKLKGFVIVSKIEAYEILTNDRSDVILKPTELKNIVCEGYGPSEESNSNPQIEQAQGPTEAVPLLNSFSGSSRVIYLDFDGYILPANKMWNNNNSVTTYGPSWNAAQMTITWQQVSEDYAPFQVNVTTDEAVFFAAPDTSRMRVVVTVTNNWYPNAGGVAYLNSFDWGSDIPCWVFTAGLGNDPWNAGEAASHEAGHTVSLKHDGGTSEYYMGHNNWAPIMGGSYQKEVTQWSKGEYTNATNTSQNDVVAIASFLNYKQDDYGNDKNTSTDLVYSLQGNNAVISAVSNSGLIHERNDVDVFKFVSPAGGAYSFLVKPTAGYKTNLDIEVKIYDANNNLVQTQGTGHSNINNGVTLTGTFNAGVAYYLFVDGVGTGNSNTGWSDYASVGPYSISGTVAGMIPLQLDLGVRTITGISASGCGSSVSPSVEIVNNGSVVISSADIDVLLNNSVVETVHFTGNLAMNQTAVINFSAINILVEGNNTVSVKVRNPNGGSDESASNDLLSNSFMINFGEPVTFSVSSTSYNSSIAWNIKKNNSTIKDNTSLVVESVNGFKKYNFCLVPDCYTINVSNAFLIACTQYPTWNPATIYNTGNQFSYNGRLYQVVSQIWNANPVNFPQYYTDLGPCPLTNPSDYFSLNNTLQNLELVKQTVSGYASSYTSNFCMSNVTTGIEVNKDHFFSVYPNPSADYIYFSHNTGVITIFDSNGNLLKTLVNQSQMDISTFASGLYLVQFRNDKTSANVKVVKF